MGQGCLCSTPLPDTASHSELAGFAEGSSSQPVWSSYFRRFDLARSKQKPCAIKIEIFSKLYSGLLEIMITDKLIIPRTQFAQKYKLGVTERKHGLPFKVAF